MDAVPWGFSESSIHPADNRSLAWSCARVAGSCSPSILTSANRSLLRLQLAADALQ